MRNVKIDHMELNEKTSLMAESLIIDGAREMLGKLVSHYKMSPKMKHGRDDEIYAEAEVKCILSSEENTRRFLFYGLDGMCFRNRKRDKNGTLVSLEAYYNDENTRVV